VEGPVGAAQSAPADAQRVRLRPTVEVLPARDGDIYLLRPREADVVVRAPSAEERELIERLEAGSVPLADAAGARPLIDVGVVIPWTDPAVDAVDAERFSRQLPYLTELAGPGAQRKLRDAVVVVLGCGGLGTWILGALAAAGVGRFVLIDDDTVELSNLNRQILYREADLGRPKVEAAAEWIRGFDTRVEVTAHRRRMLGPNDLDELLEGASLLVLAADWPPHELGRWVNHACVAARLPFVTAGQQPPLLKAGPIYIPGQTACLACHEAWLAEQGPIYIELAEHRRRHPGTALTLGPASALIGGLVATDAMHLLAGAGPPATAGAAMLIDMRTLQVRWEPIARRADCGECSPLY
jgi:bacteriocin biosynthesis cyclodehydratase domain-containing protein